MTRLRNTLLGAAALVALALPATAQAQGLAGASGSVEGGYSWAEDSGVDADTWTFGGDILAGLANALAVQGGIHYGTSESAGFDVDTWDFNAGLVYKLTQGKVGAAINYTTVDVGSVGDTDAWTFSGMGEFYPSEMFSIGGQLSFVDTDFGEGWGIGGGAKVYAMPNLALGANISYFDADGGGSVTDWGIGVEFMPFYGTAGNAGLPLSVGLGYTRAESFGDVDVFSAAVKFYFGGNGGDNSLRGFHRNGPLKPTRFTF